ncbi:MAG: TetR/AcrR family transcriptional regulator [Alphaproteobacteria bacterium]|nr:TetR/AcrR family transcriptional regulator [Alphaproteobacteria bacterium]
MPKLSPDTQRARREHILDAAELCFSRAGFHRCTMQDICKEAGVSPGALYLYFDSKEDLIAGIAERERAEFQSRFADMADAPDFLQALSVLGEQYFVEEPAHRRLMCVEIGVEATRNDTVSEIYRSVDDVVMQSFETLFQRLKNEGRIQPTEDIPTLAKLFALIGDGMVWRRATDPKFDAETLLPAVTRLITLMMQPTPIADTEKTEAETETPANVAAQKVQA